MRPFVYENPTKIVFGCGALGELSRHVPPGRKVLLVAGGGSIKHNGVHDKVRESLGQLEVEEFFGVEPNPDFATLMRAVELVRRKNIDFLLAVGGGSVVDGTKFIAAAAHHPGDPWKILSAGAEVSQAVPLGCVLTLPATGSEMNPTAVISRRETGEKLHFSTPRVFPTFAVLDPETTRSLPPRQTANGVVDAFVHVLEQYATYPVGATVQDRFAESLLQTLLEWGPLAYAEPDNLAARSNVMWAATMALNGLIGVGVPQDWSTHMIGHALTARFGLDHARTLALVWPWLMRCRLTAKADKLAQMGRRVFGLEGSEVSALAERSIVATEQFFESLAVPTRLSAIGLDADPIGPVLDNLARHGLVALGERDEVTLQVVEAALRRSLTA
jgi:NADP-dependent alcohol dehydrogenase